VFQSPAVRLGQNGLLCYMEHSLAMCMLADAYKFADVLQLNLVQDGREGGIIVSYRGFLS
jgi:hypothetical protein